MLNARGFIGWVNCSFAARLRPSFDVQRTAQTVFRLDPPDDVVGLAARSHAERIG
jgi:hypothetical protein